MTTAIARRCYVAGLSSWLFTVVGLCATPVRATTVLVDSFTSGSQSLFLTATSGSLVSQAVTSVTTISGDRTLSLKTGSSGMPSGQQAESAVSPAAGAFNALVTGAAPLTEVALSWGNTVWPASPYNFAAAIGSSIYQDYRFEIDFSNLQFPTGSRTLVFDVYSQGGGTAVYQAVLSDIPSSGTVSLSYAATVGAPDLTQVIGMVLTTEVAIGTGTSTSFQFDEIRAVPEPSAYAMALAGLACGGFSMWRRRKRA